MNWAATQAKAKFSELLNKAESEGPQIVRRRKREFYVLTKEQLEEHAKSGSAEKGSFVSAWDALRPASDLCFDFNFPRARGKARAAKF